MQAKVIDERVTENLVTEYLLQPVTCTGAPDFMVNDARPFWRDARLINPEDLEPVSRRALFGGNDAHHFGFDENGNRLA